MSGKILMPLLCGGMLMVATAASAVDGNPLGGVGVGVESSPGGIIIAQSTSNSTGSVTVTLKAGTYQLTLTGAPVRSKDGVVIDATAKAGNVVLKRGWIECKPNVDKCGPTGTFTVKAPGPVVFEFRQGRGIATGRGGGAF